MLVLKQSAEKWPFSAGGVVWPLRPLPPPDPPPGYGPG